jgi:D-lactate dehydrogenase
MKVAVFSTKPYDREYLDRANAGHGHALTFFDAHLDRETAILGAGHGAVCAFVNDVLDSEVLRQLAAGGARLIALRSAGFNQVDLAAARSHGLVVARVPAYSPYAVAEHAVGLILTLNRKYHRAYNRVRDGNFSLQGLRGFDLHGRTVGTVGTGKIGAVFARIMLGFGCRVLAFDPAPDQGSRDLGVEYVALDELLRTSDIVSLHAPLSERTHHLIDAARLSLMKRGVMLINTSRGALIDTRAVIEALKSGQIGYLGIDVYEEEEQLFFEDLSSEIIHDDVFMRLLTFPNVIVTAHQAFFTEEALLNIASTTLANITAFERGTGELHRVEAP